MPALTRRRSGDHRQECWQIHYGDIYAGTITERVGNPHDTNRWEWRCGFCPGSAPGEYLTGIAATFDQARVGFAKAWQVFSAKRTEAPIRLGAISGIGRNVNMPCGPRARDFL